MSNSIVAAIYRHVIEDVVRNVHDDFEGHGVDISVLEELQRSWEAKIVQSRVAAFPNDDPYQSNGNQPHIPTGPGAVDPTASYYGGYPANSSAATINNGGAAGNNINSAASLASIIHSESMAPSAASLASLAQSGRGQPSLLDDDEVNSHGGYNYNHHHIPQNDGPSDENSQHKEESDEHLARWRSLCAARRTEYQRDLELAASNLKENTSIPQTDGAPDGGGGSEETKSNNNISSTAGEDKKKHLSLPQAIKQEEGEGEEKEKVEDPDELINSDLDDSDDEDDYEDGAEDTEHVVLCQYDKVTRTKNKWKCVLRDGIMLINGRDYLFQKANGDFEW